MKKLTVVIFGLMVVFLALAIITTDYSVRRTITAIDSIGKVRFDEDSKVKLDIAIEYYDALDTSIGLDGRVTNIGTLKAAKLEYVRLVIKTAKVKHERKAAEGSTDGEIAAALAVAREAVDTYCGGEICAELENYAELIALEAQYGAVAPTDDGTADDSAGNGEEAEEIELC